MQGNILLSIGTPKGLIIAADLFVVSLSSLRRLHARDLCNECQESAGEVAAPVTP